MRAQSIVGGTFSYGHRPAFGIMAPLYDGEPNPPAPPPANPPAPEPKVLQITEDEFEQRIVGRIKQAEAQWKKSNVVSTLTAEERVELETARKEREEQKRKELESKGQYDAALQSQAESIRKEYEPKLKEREEKLTGVTGRLRQEIVTNKLLAAAATGNAFNANQVVKLTEGYVKLDDDFQPTVVDAEGHARFVAGKPMTVEQLVEEFLRENPNHVKAPAGMQGGGAQGGASKTGAEPSELAVLEKEVADLAATYQKTRDVDVLTQHRKKSNELKQARNKTAA